MSRRHLFHVYFEPQFSLLTRASHAGTITKESERSFSHFTRGKRGGLRAAGENGLQDISTLLPGLIGFIDFLVVLPWRPCLPWKRINIPPFVRSEMRIDGHRNLVNGLVSHSDLCFRRNLCRLCAFHESSITLSRSTKYSLHLYSCNDTHIILLKAN